MKFKDKISYYCFNKCCENSIYFNKSVKVTDMPYDEQTLNSEHHCILCGKKLVSTIDIELRQALFFKRQMSVIYDDKVNIEVPYN